MPDSSPCKKKKKLTLVACQQGLETAERALIRLGFDSKSNFAVAYLSRTTVTKFFNQVPIQLDSFKTICDALKLKWQEIAGITEESRNYEKIEKQVNPSPDIWERVKIKIKILSRTVTVVDKPSQTIKSVIKLNGDIDSIANIQILAFILKQYGGDTIEITDIQEGSIKLVIEGSQEDIQRLLIQIKSGELTELDGFPVEDAQILSESLEDSDSSEEKWLLIEEIVTNHIIGRDLSGADLSDADLRNACLIDANLSEADLNDSDLSGASLSGADLSGASLSGADLSRTKLSSLHLRSAFGNLSRVHMSAFGNLSGANMSGTDLSATNLSATNLRGADLRGADLRGAHLRGANLSVVYLNGANLSDTKLTFANLSGTKLIVANLSGAKLIFANLSGANLSGANLSRANLSRANLSDANLSGIQVEKTRFLDNLGITEEQKKDLIKRGAIFDDSPGNPAGILTRV